MDKLIEKFNLNNKKGIENLVILLVIIVIIMVVINSLFNEEKEMVSPVVNVVKNESNEDILETKLKSILESIKGIGNVKVMVSYTNSIEKIPLYDKKETTTITEEKDNQGGERKTEEISNELKIVYEEGNNNKTAIIKQNIMPEIIGVIVTAEGAENNIIKEQIINAVVAVTNIPNHKVQVFAQ